MLGTAQPSLVFLSPAVTQATGRRVRAAEYNGTKSAPLSFTGAIMGQRVAADRDPAETAAARAGNRLSLRVNRGTAAPNQYIAEICYLRRHHTRGSIQ